MIPLGYSDFGSAIELGSPFVALMTAITMTTKIQVNTIMSSRAKPLSGVPLNLRLMPLLIIQKIS